MGTEIERKFLIHVANFTALEVFPRGLANIHQTQITQGYLSRKPAVRVRHSSTGPNHAQGFVTIKGSGNITRGEWEYPIPELDALEMMALCPSVLRKIRYVIPVTEPGSTHLKWEVDQFLTEGLSGLWVAEIELSHPDENFPRPAWLGREVSEDSRYSNASLAQTHTIPSNEPQDPRG